MKFKLLLIPIFALFVSCSNQTGFDRDKETKAILELHNLQRDYHFNKDSISFANLLSKNFISVNKGIISRPKKSEIISRYNNYFSSVEFVKWDDISEPVIKFSDDGTLAYTIVNKIVKITYNNEKGETIEGETHFAWTAIYRKYGNEWKIDCLTSTEEHQSIEKN
ncbi:nuclear transport factor 2 family protein [Aestuariivivens sediminis]|uniref:nuclear transport factor 2 family protein n=1 Tax=Aestuariivivens sediminis TaxID=2913557 RepID=UPI001F58E553|nr:nuclear transport factor 2 family protein [Aestuariivivens sediminis]